MAELISKLWGQGIEIDVFDGDAEGTGTILTAAALGLADTDPVGGTVAGPLEAGAVDKGFEEVHGVAVLGLPVGREAASQAGQEVAGEVRDTDPGKDQEAHIVGNPREALGTGGVAPSDELIAWLDPPGGSAKERTGDVAAHGVADQVSHVFAHGPAQAEIVVTDEVVGQDPVAGLLGREGLDGQGRDLGQGTSDGVGIGPLLTSV